MMKRIISAIAIVCSLLCICLYTRTTGVYFIAENNEIKTAIKSVGMHLEEAREHLVKCKCIQVIMYMEEAQAYIEEEDYISAIEVLSEGAEETGNAALAEKEKDLREHIVIKKKETYRDGKLIEEDEYDIAGHILQTIFYDNDVISYWYEYDDLGNNIKRVRRDSAGDITHWVEYEYDESGNKTKDTYYGSNGIIWYETEYDEKGNEIKYIVHNSEDGSIYGWIKYEHEYDDMGNEIKYAWYNSDGRSGKYHEAEYDETENLVKMIYYTYDNNVDYWIEYEYDYSESGSQKKEISYYSGGVVKNVEEYEYDAMGNMIKSTYSVDNEVKSALEYVYEYAYQSI